LNFLTYLALEPPKDREWVVIEDEPIPNEDKLMVLTYNILSHKYCTEELYGYTPSDARSWEHRSSLIMGELEAREPDIMCFQEVQGDAYENFYRPKLAHRDYKGIFFPKGRAKTMSISQAKEVDGCATFYKNSK
jgi:CCR4-NOT transcription complex subunit 6